MFRDCLVRCKKKSTFGLQNHKFGIVELLQALVDAVYAGGFVFEDIIILLVSTFSLSIMMCSFFMNQLCIKCSIIRTPYAYSTSGIDSPRCIWHNLLYCFRSCSPAKYLRWFSNCFDWKCRWWIHCRRSACLPSKLWLWYVWRAFTVGRTINYLLFRTPHIFSKWFTGLPYFVW